MLLATFGEDDDEVMADRAGLCGDLEIVIYFTCFSLDQTAPKFIPLGKAWVGKLHRQLLRASRNGALFVLLWIGITFVMLCTHLFTQRLSVYFGVCFVVQHDNGSTRRQHEQRGDDHRGEGAPPSDGEGRWTARSRLLAQTPFVGAQCG